MRKILLLLAVVASVSFSAFAQIPNNGFENWTGNNPTDWSTANPYTSLGGVYTCTKGMPGAVGSSYINLTTKYVALLGRTIPGAAFSGLITVDLAAGTVTPKSGFAFSQRPQNLTGQWQYMGATAADVGFMGVLLTKWNTLANKRDTVAVGYRDLTGMVMSWSPFSIPLTYKKTIMPDSCMIWMSASNATAPTANSYLYVDGLAFTGTVSGLTANQEAVSGLAAYPNPVREKLTVEFAAAKKEELTIELTDVMGRVVKNVFAGPVFGKYHQELPVSDLAKGLYLLKISSSETVQTKRIVIE
jgi:hypothetical protein